MGWTTLETNLQRDMTPGGVVVTHLSKSFDGHRNVLEDLNFEVPSKSVASFLGPSGCGKTTLLRILCGLENPSSGSVVADGSSIAILREKGRIGVAFQEPALFPWRSVAQNISLPLEIQKRREPDKVARVISLVRLEGSERLLPCQLSGGMAQRVSVARALVSDPEMLLLDEPFGALDWFLRRQIIVDFETVWLRTKPTTLIVTHEAREAVFLADQIFVMSTQPGKIVDSIAVPFARPRSASLFVSAQFHELCDLVDARCQPGK